MNKIRDGKGSIIWDLIKYRGLFGYILRIYIYFSELENLEIDIFLDINDLLLRYNGINSLSRFITIREFINFLININNRD